MSAVLLLTGPGPSGAHEGAGEPYAPASGSSSPLPALGDTASQDLSPTAERRLGDRIMRAVLPDPTVLDDPLILEYVDQVWRTLLSSARQRGEISPEIDELYAWRPFLVQDRTVNAFALPGGYIGVHLGLLAMTSTPDELASVLAHEMSHVTQRHIARTMGAQSRQGWISLASIILGIMAASRDPQAAQAVIMGGQAASLQGQLNFSRDMEREADRVGFGVLTDAGFSPSGMAQMFEHLQMASRLNDDGSYPYLRTHPLTTERIGEARARLGPNGWNTSAAASGTPDPAQRAMVARHLLMAARARVLMDTRSSFVSTLTHAGIKADTPALPALVQHYTAAMANMRLADTEAAARDLKAARAYLPKLPAAQAAEAERVLTLTEAEWHLHTRQPQSTASEWTQWPWPRLPDNAPGRPERLMAAQLALAMPEGPQRVKALQAAANHLQTHVSEHAYDATAWGLLSEIWQQLNEPIRAVRAEAEASAAKGDLPGAIDRVQGAQKRFRQPSAADVIELSVMDARLKVWQRQQREDMREDAAR